MEQTTALTTDSAEFLSRLRDSAPLVVLTGAGISSGSGIPTYRDRRGVWLRSDPITHQQFVGEHRQRQRYWGRSTLGWPAVANARPSFAHEALTHLEAADLIAHVITQNVDRLHQRAGTRRVIDLHGRLDRVRCLECGDEQHRRVMQQRLVTLNPWLDRPVSSLRPDGDADLLESEVDAVQVPDCALCAGMLMPDVVFFGGSIPAQRTRECQRLVEEAGGLLVVGSSLKVYSGFRLCRQASTAGKPLFIVNPGITRADPITDARLPMEADDALRLWLDKVAPAADSHCKGTAS